MSKQFMNMNDMGNGDGISNPWYKRLIYIAIALFLAAGAFYFAGFGPAWQKVKALEAEQQEKESFLQKTEEVLQIKRNETAQGNQLNSDDQLPPAALPTTPDQRGILEDLESAAQQAGVQLLHVMFKPDEGPVSEEGTGTNGGFEQVDFQSAGLIPLYFEVSINGNLAGIKSFTTSLQEEERLYAVKEFRYGSPADMQSETTTIAMAAFYRLADQ